MHPDVDTHSPRVAEAVRALERALAELAAALAHRDVRIETATGGTAAEQRRQVADAYSTIDYADADAVNATCDCLAVVAAPREVVQLAMAVNQAKARLKHTCGALQGRQIRVPVRARGADAGTEKVELIRAILRSLQRSDLNLLAAYRKIPILAVAPALIVYTRASTRAVYRRSRAEVLEMLEVGVRPAALDDRARIRSCRDRWFALVRDHYPSIRANVKYVGLDTRHRGRVQVRAELPLMFTLGRSTSWPEIRFASNAPSHGPARKRAGVLEEEPFLQTLAVYRYRPAE